MTRFLAKLAFFLVTSFALLNVAAAIYGATSRRQIEREGSEVYDAIRRSQQPSAATTLVLGDSVSHQLLLNTNFKDTLNLSTNQAISICGQYLLAQQAVAHDPALKQIILAYQPKCFQNDLEESFTFNYFVKPFYTRTLFRPQMDALIFQRLNRRPRYRLMLLPMFRYTDLLASTDYSTTKPTDFRYLAPVSIDYLQKLSDLCHEHHLQLRIVSTPVSTSRPVDLEKFLNEISTAHLDDLFSGYAATIRAVDAAEFGDNVHFIERRIPENSAPFVKMLGLK